MCVSCLFVRSDTVLLHLRMPSTDLTTPLKLEPQTGQAYKTFWLEITNQLLNLHKLFYLNILWQFVSLSSNLLSEPVQPIEGSSVAWRERQEIIVRALPFIWRTNNLISAKLSSDWAGVGPSWTITILIFLLWKDFILILSSQNYQKYIVRVGNFLYKAPYNFNSYVVMLCFNKINFEHL